MILSATRVAAYVARGRVPPARELFVLSAAVVEGARREDVPALELGLDSAAALLENLPPEGAWDACRGHLNAIMEFAWLLRHARRTDDPETRHGTESSNGRGHAAG